MQDRGGVRGVRRLRAFALLAVLATTAACGARLDEEQVAALARSRSSGTGTTVPGANAPTTTVATGSSAPGAADASGASSGAAAGPAGGGGADVGGQQAAAGSAECIPAGAPDVGITENEIVLGEVATLSGPVPGLAQTAVNGARAYFEYRNAVEGGVCGRSVRVVVADDRLDTGQNRSETQRLAPQVFGFVGGWGVTDDGGAAVLNGTNIPDVGIAISEDRAALPNNFSSNPIALDGSSGATTILRYMQNTYQPASAAVVWGAQATARARAQGFVRDLQSLGMNVIVQREVAITETNYVSVAQEIENAGAELVITALEITGISRLAQAFEQVGYLPKVPYYGAQTYGDRFLELAGSAANGAIIGITHPIVEEAASNPATATFLEWYQRVNPGAEIDFFAFQGWVAADMFADAIEQAGPSPTRDAVLEVLRTFTSYDADGLVAAINPAQKINASCYLIVTVRDGSWQRVHPQGSGYACE
jgi:ABC-type branched-subunit amino acid transport system substrate-binding protein